MKDLIAALNASLDPMLLLTRISEQACVFSPKADGAAVSLCMSDGSLVFVSAYGLSHPALGLVAPKEGSFQTLALDSRQPQITNDAVRDERLTARTRDFAAQMNIRSWAAVPLHHGDQAVGVLSLVASDTEAFAEVDLAGISSISRFVAALIGSQSGILRLVEDLLDEPGNPVQPPTVRFMSALLQPDRERNAELEKRLDTLLADPASLSAVFQPLVELRSRRTLGFEGLCRVPGAPDRSPSQWFALARLLGRGVELEERVLDVVLEASAVIPESYVVGVNLGPLAASTRSVQETVLTAGRSLVIELTEHEPFPDELGHRLQPVRDGGILVALDDAGAGFASFSKLLALRPDIIKLDRDLISGVDHDPVRRALITSVVAIAAELNAATVAEGIETKEQLDVLQRLGIDHGQGYLFGHPRPSSELDLAP